MQEIVKRLNKKIDHLYLEFLDMNKVRLRYHSKFVEYISQEYTLATWYRMLGNSRNRNIEITLTSVDNNNVILSLKCDKDGRVENLKITMGSVSKKILSLEVW